MKKLILTFVFIVAWLSVSAQTYRFNLSSFTTDTTLQLEFNSPGTIGITISSYLISPVNNSEVQLYTSDNGTVFHPLSQPAIPVTILDDSSWYFRADLMTKHILFRIVRNNDNAGTITINIESYEARLSRVKPATVESYSNYPQIRLDEHVDNCITRIIDLSGSDTTGVLALGNSKWSCEILNDSISSGTPIIDFKATNKEDATFASLADLVFNNTDYDSIPYTLGTGKRNYPFGNQYGNYKYLYYKATKSGSTEKIIFLFCKFE